MDRNTQLVGQSSSFLDAVERASRAAPLDRPVLVVGERGTGKELIAERLHHLSSRWDGPLVAMNCAALPETLIEAELFGHEAGAFTGAAKARAGRFEEADGGTLFLDELGEMPLGLQSKLLHALEHREVKRVGSNRYLPVDVRVIAATNRNLREEVNQRRFRSDVYYRLAVLQMKLPPLRERLDDVPLLANHFLDLIEKRSRRPSDTAFLRTPEFAAELCSHRWPGNLRELRNYIERCYALREAVQLDPADPATGDDAGAPPAAAALIDAPLIDASLPLREARERWSNDFERRYLEQLLARHGGNVRDTARAAGVDRVYLYRLLWKYGLKSRNG
jgi:DNA-binding NtrC family response regulator